MDNGQKDHSSWTYADFSDPTDREFVHSNLAPVLFLDYSTRLPAVAGMAFVVGASATHVICMTACHVLTEAVRRSHPANRYRTNALSNDLSALQVTRAIESSRIAIPIWNGLRHEQASVECGWFAEDIDVALLMVRRSATGDTQIRPALSINSDLLPVGTSVLSVCYSDGVFEPRDAMDASTITEFVTQVHLRAGRITAIHPTGRLPKSVVYETSIPCTPGMSGGPLLLAPDRPGSVACAIGMISSDLSLALDDPAIGGSSQAIAAFAAYAALLPHGLGTVEFLELRQKGVVRDVGALANSIRVRRDPANQQSVVVEHELEAMK